MSLGRSLPIAPRSPRGRRLTAAIWLIWLLAGAASALPAPPPEPEHALLDPQGRRQIFIETEVSDRQPYLQQSVGVVVRLYFSTALVSGSLDLDTPAGASLQRVGDDSDGVRVIDGRRYNLVERRFLLQPERSGPLRLAGARFAGRGLTDALQQQDPRVGEVLRVQGPAQTLQVRAIPAAAAQPWLPLRGLRLGYVQAPHTAEVGQAVTVEIEASAVGVTQAQFTELPVPKVEGAQVLAEPAQQHERLRDGTPQLTVTRRYAIVPTQAGSLRLSLPAIDWWDVTAGAARRAELPPLTIAVSGGRGTVAAADAGEVAKAGALNMGTSAAAANGSTGEDRAASSGTAARPWRWIALAALFAALWLATLALLLWFWRRARSRPALPQSGVALSTAIPARRSSSELRRALAGAGLDEVAACLCAMAGVAELEQVVAQLASTSQREAVRQLQRARWAGDGDPVATRRALREAFQHGPHWNDAALAVDTTAELEPLYPR